MTTDVTLYEIYSELGILDLMQSDDVEEFVDEECDMVWNDTLIAA